MRAAVSERYGPPEVVRIREVETPEPGAGDVLVKAAATTVNSGDSRLRALRVPKGLGLPVRLRMGITKLRQPILGFDMAGRVDAVGGAVTEFAPGDRVVASLDFGLSAHAEFMKVGEKGIIAKIPDGLSDEDAVALGFGGTTALGFLRMGKLAAGESILINGASGAVGVMAVQLAKHLGAEVTGVCSGAHAELVKDLGADHVVDYTTDDFTSNGQRYDVIMDNHGNAPYARVAGSLAPEGRFLMVVGTLGEMLGAVRHKAVLGGTAKFDAGTYRELLDLADSGVLRSVKDTVLPFDEIVEAHRRVDAGHKTGSLVLTFG